MPVERASCDAVLAKHPGEPSFDEAIANGLVSDYRWT
jgi:hypothetical protein